MVGYSIKRFLRKPTLPIAVLLFATVLSYILCMLHVAVEQEKKNYQEMYRSIPVPVYITNLTGTAFDHLAAPGWVMDAVEIYLDNYITDPQASARITADSIKIEDSVLYDQELTGITSLSMAGELAQVTNDNIMWLGFDESILQSDTLICIIPESMIQNSGNCPASVSMKFEHIIYSYPQLEAEVKSIELTFLLAGTHKNNSGIYCPISVVEHITSKLDLEIKYDQIKGTLIDNYTMDELRDAASVWFVEPTLNGTLTPWEYYGYSYYPYALKIDESQLRAADEKLHNSLAMNNMCSLLVFGLSAIFGCLIGFLVVHSRKREISLMRTLGTPNWMIYVSFIVEQIASVAFGILIGGAKYFWKPESRLAALLILYFIGLFPALLVVMRTDLILTIKEDE